MAESRVIAVVGLSPKPERDSHRVAAYLQQQGYRIIPVYPRGQEILGERVYPSLEAIPPDIRVDLVDVFRRGPDTPPVAEAAVRRGARFLWLQLGIRCERSRELAEAAGLEVVMDACMMIEHRLRNPAGRGEISGGTGEPGTGPGAGPD
ncbi:MAG: CoA-binding protein [Firmicutes bacterium]|nr:CoA-binding protein [Bacillota bacterium]